MAVEYMFDYTAAAPEITPQPLPKQKPEVQRDPELKKVKKSYAEVKRQTETSHAKAFRFATAVIAVMMLFVVFCTSLSQLRASRLKYNDQLEQLDIYKNDQRQVTAHLTKLVSVDKIEAIAVEKLGMIKIAKENIIYVDTADKNEVISGETNG